MKFFDTHAHYYDERFVSECEEGVEALLDALFEDSVSYIVNVGTSADTSLLAIRQAQKYPNMYTAIGLHPSDTRFVSNLDDELKKIRSLILDKSSKCVLLGEIGLDYHYPDTNKELQMRAFRAQMDMAKELEIPVCIHDRDSHEDVLQVLREYAGSVYGILHSFSGSLEMARELIKLGYYISFSGTLTFKNARKPKEVAAGIPRDRILIETDAPYLAPHPKRGTLNNSGNLILTASALADILCVDVQEAARITEENAKRLLKI